MHHKGFPPILTLALCLLVSPLIFLIYWIPLFIVGIFIIPLKLMTGWDGTTGVFGNRKHTATDQRWTGFWSAWHYLAWRNPISNYSHDILAMAIDPLQDTDIWGFTGTTDGPAKVKGWYFILTPMGAWEMRIVWPSFFTAPAAPFLDW